MTQANLGLLLLARGDQEGARRELQAARKLAHDERATLLAIGNGLRRAGDAPGALEAMQAALANDPQPTPALLSELALAQRAAGDRDAAIASLQRALQRDPHYATAHYVLANMLASDGKRAPARKHFQRYLELEPRGPHAAQARERLQVLGRSSK
jgi:superkiller protein 3